MSLACFIGLGVLGFCLVLFGLFEVHYFLRMAWCVFLARFVKRKCNILEPTVVTGFCTSNDIDALLYHMNNARFLREIDFARVDFYERTSLYRTIKSKGGSVFQGAATIRYRKFIRPFHCFQIVSRIVFWDHQYLYMEHRFINPSDSFIHAIALCRQRFINCNTEEIITELLSPKSVQVTTSTTILHKTPSHQNAAITMESNFGATRCLENDENGEMACKLRPDLPEDLSKWIEYNDISSKNLRPS